MSKIVLGWQLNEDVEDAHVRRTIELVKGRYQPLFQDTIVHTGLWRERQGLLHFDISQPGDPGLWATDDRIICLTGSPTITADESAPSAIAPDARTLHAYLAGSSTSLNRRALHEINPPFTLSWYDATARLLHVVHDGLGMDQFFIVTTPKGVAFSNKCWPILLFLDESPRLDRAAWQQWFCLGWMLGHATPFQHIRYLERGEIIRGDAHAIVFDAEDPLRDWIAASRDHDVPTLIRRAAASVRQIVRAHRPLDGARYPADLTGGRDSRAICSILVKENLSSTFITGGPQHSADVILARRIAQRFNLHWQHVAEPRFERDYSSPLLETLFEKLVLWGEGLVEATRFSHFEPDRCATEHGAYLSGGQGEISKCQYDARIARRYPRPPPDFRTSQIPFELSIHQLLPDDDAINMKAHLREQVAAGESYGIAGWPLLDYFHVTNRTRRWQAAHLAVNLFDRTVLPFANIDHIRLAFALAPPDKANRTLQTFIIEDNARDLLQIPFADSIGSRLRSRLAGLRRTYTWIDYLRGDGRALVESLFASHSALWQILDKDKTRAIWTDFVRGNSRDTLLILGLLSFRHWYDMYIAGAPAEHARVHRFEPVQHHGG